MSKEDVDYKDIKKAIESERELLAFMVKLDAAKWNDLMVLSREINHRTMQETVQTLEMQKMDQEHEMKLKNLADSEKKREHEKAMVEFRIKKEVEAEAEKTRLRLQAES